MKPVLSAVQQQRLAQIRLSVTGFPALLRDDIAAQINLSGDQRTQIEQVLQEASTAGSKTAPPKAESDAAANPSQPRADDATTRISAILTRQQRATAREILGPPLDGSKLGYVKFRAPELQGQDGWLNSKPLTLSQLHGQVVALHFWTYG